VTPTDLFIIIAAVSLAAIAIFLIPLLIQFRQTLLRADLLIDSMSKELPATVTALNEAASEVKDLSANLGHKLEQTETFINTLERSGDVILSTSKLLRDTAAPVITEVGALSAGMKAFMYFFTRPHKSR